jgi:membrane-bound lytic murein transglycosylase F
MRLFLLFLLITIISACSSEQVVSYMSEGQITPAPTPDKPQEVVIVTHAGPNTYFINADNQYAGIEYDLANLFSKKYAPEYKIKFLVVQKISDVVPALLLGKAHIAASNLAITPERQSRVSFSTPYYQTQHQLVYNKKFGKKPKQLAQIKGKSFVVPAASSSSEILNQMTRKLPDLIWQEDSLNNAEVLLRKVADGDVDYTVANHQLVNLMKNYYPNLRTALPIGIEQKVAWAFSPHQDKRLESRVNAFFKTIKKNGELRNLVDRYHGHTDRLKPVDVNYFLKRVDTILPKYKRIFKQAEKATGLNWRLLAALSFRESHWDPLNTSPTNVRGMMMLTEPTAEALGVTDRLDPKQSIPAGAKYILQLKNKFPKSVPEQDRTYLALAAYYIGYAHVLDARRLARRLNLNPDSWVDIKKTLFMLNDPKYYSTVKYGYASGGAPIIFVETIRSYQRILEKYQPSRTQMLSNNFVASR